MGVRVDTMRLMKKALSSFSFLFLFCFAFSSLYTSSAYRRVRRDGRQAKRTHQLDDTRERGWREPRSNSREQENQKKKRNEGRGRGREFRRRVREHSLKAKLQRRREEGGSLEVKQGRNALWEPANTPVVRRRGKWRWEQVRESKKGGWVLARRLADTPTHPHTRTLTHPSQSASRLIAAHKTATAAIQKRCDEDDWREAQNVG